MRYADTAMSLKESELGMLLKLADMPEYYNFASGYPAEELFPLEELEAVDRAILRKEGKLAVQYGSSKGYLPLREKIAQRMKTAFFADCQAEDILITSGSQQGLSMLGQLFLNKDDVVLVESPFAQRQIEYYMDMYDLDGHIAKMKAVYKRRRDLICEAIHTYFPENVSSTYPEGGLFVWVTLPEGTDAKQLMEKAMAKKVAYVPAASFYPNGGNENHFRLNFSTMNEERIEEGIRVLADVLKDALKN